MNREAPDPERHTGVQRARRTMRQETRLLSDGGGQPRNAIVSTSGHFCPSSRAVDPRTGCPRRSGVGRALPLHPA
jgi:hypothetical protein